MFDVVDTSFSYGKMENDWSSANNLTNTELTSWNVWYKVLISDCAALNDEY